MIDREPVIDNFLFIGSLFAGTCLDFLYILSNNSQIKMKTYFNGVFIFNFSSS